jgi:hypothetical protein
MMVTIRNMLLVSLWLIGCVCGDICPGQVVTTLPSDSCGLDNVTSVSLWNIQSGINRHEIQSVPCASAFEFRFAMTCPVAQFSAQVCDGASGQCSTCSQIHCWSLFFGEGWVNEVHCSSFNSSGHQSVVLSLRQPFTGYEILHHTIQVLCPGAQDGSNSPSSCTPSITAPLAPSQTPGAQSCDSSHDLIIIHPPFNFQKPNGVALSCGTSFVAEIITSGRPDHLAVQVCDAVSGFCLRCDTENAELNQFDSDGFATNVTCRAPFDTGNRTVSATYLPRGGGGEQSNLVSVNTTVRVECVQDETGCEATNNITLAPYYNGSLNNLTCGDSVLLSATSITGVCTFVPIQLRVCDGNLERCQICSGAYCQTIAVDGVQIFVLNYTYGPLVDDVRLAVNISCPSPAALCARQEPRLDTIFPFTGNPRPQSPRPACNTSFEVQIILGCGPVSVTTQVCDDETGQCESCPMPIWGFGGWEGIASCRTLPRTGNQTIVVSYQLLPDSEVKTLNKTLEVECLQDETGCGHPAFLFVYELGCGNAYLRLFSDGMCTIDTTGMQVCLPDGENCTFCEGYKVNPTRLDFLCWGIPQVTGPLNFTAFYSYGPRNGSVSIIERQICFTPELPPTTSPLSPPISPTSPNSPISPSVPVPCASSTVSFVTETPGAGETLHCGGRLVFNLSSTSDCSLTSGLILVCDYQRHNCIQFTPSTSQPHGPVIFDVQNSSSINGLQGPLVVTSTYQIGPYIGTLSTAVNKDVCPRPPELL